MRLRTLSPWPIIAALLITTACSSTAADQETVTNSASVTQTAPSVWATPTSQPDESAADGTVTSAPATLPGLSADCTAAIRSQATVNDLISRALAAASDKLVATASGAEPSVADESEADQPILTSQEVAEAFESIEGSVPAALESAFEELHQAAQELTDLEPSKVPDLLEKSEVTAALSEISNYIQGCQPTTTG